MNILFILSELIFLLFIFPIVCLFPCRWWKKNCLRVFNRNDKLFVNFRMWNAFHSLAGYRTRSGKSACSAQFSFHLFYSFTSLYRLHCLYNSELILPFYLLAKFLQLNLWLRMDYHVDCAPHTQTFNYWSWRRNFIIINIYVGRGESKLQQA